MSGQALRPLDWLNHLPERGREFERRAEEWREAEQRYIHLNRQAQEALRRLRERADEAEKAAELYWLASEIEAAKACYEAERQDRDCSCGQYVSTFSAAQESPDAR